MTAEIKIHAAPSAPGELSDAFRRMARTTLDGCARQASVRSLAEMRAALEVKERRAAWWFRWLRPVRRWWDKRETRRCDYRRALHMTAAAKFSHVASCAMREVPE